MKQATRILVSILVGALLVGACSTIVGETPGGQPTDRGDGRAPTSATAGTTPRECIRSNAGATPISSGSVAGDALFLSAELFRCADEVVVVAEGDLNQVAVAAQLAAALEGPLLHPDPRLAAELGRLKPERVYVLGDVDVVVPPGAELFRPGIGEAVERAGEALATTETVPLPSTPDASTVVETVEAITSRRRVVLPETDPSPTTGAPVVPDPDVGALIQGLANPTESEPVWLVPADQPTAILSAAATGRAIGATVIAYDLGDLFAYPEVGEALAGRSAETIRFIGAVPEESDWKLGVLANGAQVPGGGFTVLPDDRPRRYVAFYGHPGTVGLGVLGQQGPEETLERMAPYLEAYAADGSQVIPTFEIIASVASAGPTEDGDYSFEWPISTFRRWIEVAQANDAYIVFDLQPGREDFLSQAKQYEELLKLPFVGLALDPEWRLKPDQVHLRQIGQVDAAEVNLVIDWLADLVRDNGLPQKMLVVHQFQTRMILNRETLKQRPEIQLVIQMDGQGPIPTKDETYAVLTAGTEVAPWRWGWKNFFVMDSPTPTPEYTLSKNPVPVFVSYQ